MDNLGLLHTAKNTGVQDPVFYFPNPCRVSPERAVFNRTSISLYSRDPVSSTRMGSLYFMAPPTVPPRSHLSPSSNFHHFQTFKSPHILPFLKAVSQQLVKNYYERIPNFIYLCDCKPGDSENRSIIE